MRWRRRIFENGETRTKSGFLLFPKTIAVNGYTETRWLEHATWRDQYNASWGDNYWSAIHWVEEK